MYEQPIIMCTELIQLLDTYPKHAAIQTNNSLGLRESFKFVIRATYPPLGEHSKPFFSGMFVNEKCLTKKLMTNHLWLKKMYSFFGATFYLWKPLLPFIQIQKNNQKTWIGFKNLFPFPIGFPIQKSDKVIFFNIEILFSVKKSRNQFNTSKVIPCVSAHQPADLLSFIRWFNIGNRYCIL